MDAVLIKPIRRSELLAAVSYARQQPQDTETDRGAGSTPPPAGADVVCCAATLERLDGDEELFREMARVFIGSATTHQQQLGRALRQRDAAELARAAHRLKGSVGNFAADRVYAAVRLLEQQASAPDWDLLPAQVEHVQRLLDDMTNRLRQYTRTD